MQNRNSANMGKRFMVLVLTVLIASTQIVYFYKYGKEGSNSQLNVLLLTYQRSGSSFTGELLASCEECSYFFEPLFLEENIHNSTSPNAYRNILAGIFSCDNKMLDILRFKVNEFWVVRKFGQNYGVYNKKEDDIAKRCRQDNMKVIKTIRIGVEEIVPLLAEFDNLKIIHLVRDPRGILNSIGKETFWAMKHRSATRQCTAMENDIKAGEKISNERYYLVHYENLVENPLQEIEKIYRFLGRTTTNNTKLFIQKHTKAEMDQIGRNESSLYFSTFRDTSFDPNAWKTQMSERLKGQIEVICKDVLTKLNYTSINEYFK